MKHTRHTLQRHRSIHIRPPRAASHGPLSIRTVKHESVDSLTTTTRSPRRESRPSLIHFKEANAREYIPSLTAASQ